MTSGAQATPALGTRCARAVVPVAALSGCALSDYPIIDAAGPIAEAERALMIDATLLMLIVMIPVYVGLAYVLVRFRAGRARGPYAPDWTFDRRVEAAVWGVPAIIIVVLGALTWTKTHALDPARPLAGQGSPLHVQVVALDWKWLFVYPDQQVASVGELVFPAGRPLRLTLTSDSVTNSFLVPALGGQIYAMPGMTTELNLLADRTGTFEGENTQFSGEGFPQDRFAARAVTPEAFGAWLAAAKRSPRHLDGGSYVALAKPGRSAPAILYSYVEPALFSGIVAKYEGLVAPPVLPQEGD